MPDLKDEFEKDYIPKSKVREKIEEAKKLVNKLNWSYFDMSEEASEEYIKAIETVLSELEKKDKEYEELTEASKELCKTVNLMKKVINEMAEYIIDLIKYNNSEEERDKEDIKEYFTKKAEKGE